MNEDSLRRYFKALNAFDLKSVEAMFALDAVYISPGLAKPQQGRTEIMRSFSSYFAEYADQVSVDDNIKPESPNTFSSSWRLTATSSKTGKRIQRAGTQRTIFDERGLIKRVEVFDL
ncbi:MAG: nuclear transport factor 2 family protein [Alphaproteobacteria bacterium]|nr:nuclear transport factor 2 family protein [Alphaproteobacteria bacterium]